MVFASGLGIFLSLLFGCLLLALIAELYYLLWWKKLHTTTTTTTTTTTHQPKELFYLFRWNNHRREATNQERNQETLDIEEGPTKEFILKPLDNNNKNNNDNQDAALVEAELLRLQNRLLFTIKEETKEDLESEDGRSKAASRKGSRTRSLSDVMLSIDPIITPLDHCYSHHGFNPLFESSFVEAEMDRLRASPPPKFKFLRDAEEKLYKRLVQEAEKLGKVVEEEDLREGSFVRIIVGKNSNYQSSSQVLPLASSPS